MAVSWEFSQKTPHGDKVSVFVALYRATISKELITSAFQLNPMAARQDVETAALDPLPRRISPPTWPPFEVSSDSSLEALILLKMERTLSLGMTEGSHASADLTSYGIQQFPEVRQSDNRLYKVFQIQVALEETGGVSWEYKHPADGFFPYLPTQKLGKLDDFLKTTVRIDLLRRVEAFTGTTQ